jgi:Fe2+ transport system protein FeoA
MAAMGRGLKVVGLKGGTGFHRRVADMGLVPGARIELICRQHHGPVLIDLKGSRLALGRGMAHKIIVEEES